MLRAFFRYDGMTRTAKDNARLILEFLRLSTISGLVFIAALLLILFIVGWVYNDRVKDLFVQAINRQLATELYVDDIRLELLRSFPLASVTLYGVSLMESPASAEKDTLLHAAQLQLRFRPADLLRKEYNIHQIRFSRGFVRMGYDSLGTPNFDLIRREGPSHEEAVNLELQKVLLSDVDLTWYDDRRGQRLHATVASAALRGLFQQHTFQLQAVADLFAHEVTAGGAALLSAKPVKLDVAMLVEELTTFRFDKGRITVGAHDFSVEGHFAGLPGGLQADMTVRGYKLQLDALLNDLPPALSKYFTAYRARGELAFSAGISGTWSDEHIPSVRLSYSLQGGDLLFRDSGLRLRELQFAGTADNGGVRGREAITIALRDLHAGVNSGVIRGSVTVSNLVRPYLDMKLFANMDAADVVKLLRLDTVATATGRVFIDVAFQGGMSARNRFTGEDLTRARATGTVSSTMLGFTLRNDPRMYHGLNGSLLFSNNDLMIESFSGNIGRSDFTISGYFRNVLPYLFLPGETLKIDASLHARRLDFDELLRGSSSEPDTPYRLSFSSRLGFNLSASVDELHFRKFSATGFTGAVVLHDKRFYAQDVGFRSMNGRVEASGMIDGSRPDLLVTACQARLHRVDVHQLFYQMGNFGQQGILDENIFGITTSDFRFVADWTPSLQIDWGSLQTDAQIRIDDGVLVDYEPMNALGRFLRIDDLSRVTFSTLENLIHIRDRTIIIPQMEIQSNVLNLKLSGNHTFENQVEYFIQVLLSDILANRSRERRNPQERYGEVIDDGLGRTTLFVKVTGHIDNPLFAYDYQGVRQKISDDMRQERQNLREALRQEFNFLARSPADTTAVPRSERQKQRERLRQQEEGKIIIEWDDPL